MEIGLGSQSRDLIVKKSFWRWLLRRHAGSGIGRWQSTTGFCVQLQNYVSWPDAWKRDFLELVTVAPRALSFSHRRWKLPGVKVCLSSSVHWFMSPNTWHRGERYEDEDNYLFLNNSRGTVRMLSQDFLGRGNSASKRGSFPKHQIFTLFDLSTNEIDVS